MNPAIGKSNLKSEDKQGLPGKQYFSFILADEEYGVDILSVVEIRGWEKPTPLPSTPAFVKGVINLRGIIIPVIDLRERFLMPAMERGSATAIIVLQGIQRDRKKIMGIIVDAVSDVYNIEPENIRPKPEMGDKDTYEYILGLASIAQENKPDKLMIMLDAEKILTIEDVDRFMQNSHEM